MKCVGTLLSFLFLIGSLGGFTPIIPSPETLASYMIAKDPKQETQVRILGNPQGTFRTTRVVRLLRIEVRVKNVGQVPAEQVAVEATSPNGSTYQLKGPSNLAPNSDASYSSDAYEIITKDTKIKARVNCDNCYR